MKNNATPTSSIRLGLCCIFREQPIKFRNTTVKAISGMDHDAALTKLSGLCMANAEALQASLQFCADNGIGCFRINSQILPIKTHAEYGYGIADLPDCDEIVRRFQACGEFAKTNDIRTCFHPDQFVVLSSPDRNVVKNSLAELEYQAEIAEWINADVINVHGGGGYGDKPAALKRLAGAVGDLSVQARSRLTLENDDRTYTPSDLLPVCKQTGLPLVYDVHHHRCHGDDLDEETATQRAIETWNREPLFHISSPRNGWRSDNPRFHSDYIDLRDFPSLWEGLDLTVEVEAKAKELAVRKLKSALGRRAKRKATLR